MTEISYAGYRFPPEIIQRASLALLPLHVEFPRRRGFVGRTGDYRLLRDDPALGQSFRAEGRGRPAQRRPKPHATWHLDEVYLKINGRMVYLWRAVDAEGEVLDVLIQSRRNKRAALKLMRKLLKKYAFVPDRLVTDDLRSYRRRRP